jgi:hypothetical protein
LDHPAAARVSFLRRKRHENRWPLPQSPKPPSTRRQAAALLLSSTEQLHTRISHLLYVPIT